MKIRRESDEPDSGNVSDVSTEFFSGKPGDRTSYDLDVSIFSILSFNSVIFKLSVVYAI